MRLRGSRLLAVIPALSLAVCLLALPGDSLAQPRSKGPPLSSTALLSRFAKVQGVAPRPETLAGVSGRIIDAQPDTTGPRTSLASSTDSRVNQDFSLRPQNETTIAINPWSPNMLVAGANDYRLGVPIGAAFYTSFDYGSTWYDGFPPFPLLTAVRGGGVAVQEPPFGTGDPVIAFGRARAGRPQLEASTPVVYYAYLGVSASLCEHGIFVSRSTNGLTWTQPVTPPPAQRAGPAPTTGLFTPIYWDKADDCGVFNDKPWLAVDRSGGPHDGRVYVTWSQFVFSRNRYSRSPIRMAYSDDNAETWSAPIEVSGFSPALCPEKVLGPKGPCDESQFSNVVVGPDGAVYVAFLNQQLHGFWDGLRNQYLVTKVNPDTLAVSGPYQAATLIDGSGDFPVNGLGLATLCNSNFRFNSAGNIALDPSHPTGHTLFLVFADDRNGSSFPFPSRVTQEPQDSFSCPAGTTTDTDVFVVKSADGGVTWGSPSGGAGPLRVNQDDLRNGKDQWFPFASIGVDGRVDVMFYDRRDDYANRFAAVYLARSADHGVTWTETRVSSRASNMNWAFEGGLFIGDYNGMATAPDGTSYPFWTDARNGTANVRQSDVYMGAVAP